MSECTQYSANGEESATGPSNVRQSSAVFDDAVICARQMSPDALAQWADVLRADAADDDDAFPGEVGRYLARERLEAVEAELSRRERLARISEGVASPSDRKYEAWRQLAREVRERITVPDVLRVAGLDLRPESRSTRPGGAEFHARCPACRSEGYQLVSWDGVGSRAWCRQCGWSVDSIAAAQSLLPGCESFRDAVKALAEMVGQAVPR